MTNKTQIKDFLEQTAARLEGMGDRERRELLTKYGITPTAADVLGLGIYRASEDLEPLRLIYRELDIKCPDLPIIDGALIVPIVPPDPEAAPTFTTVIEVRGAVKETPPGGGLFEPSPLWLRPHRGTGTAFLTDDLADLLALADLSEEITAVYVPTKTETIGQIPVQVPDIRGLLNPEDNAKKYLLASDNSDEESNAARLSACSRLQTVVLSKIGKEVYAASLDENGQEREGQAVLRTIWTIHKNDIIKGGKSPILPGEVKEDLENLEAESEILNAEKARAYGAFDRTSTFYTTRNGGTGGYLDQIRRLSERKPLKTGLPDLDKVIGGIYPSSLYVLGAAPSTGKTSLCVQLADEILAQGQDVLFISLEQTEIELISKSISRLSFTGRGDLRKDPEQALTTNEVLYQYSKIQGNAGKKAALDGALARYNAPSETYGGLPGRLFVIHSAEDIFTMQYNAGILRARTKLTEEAEDVIQGRIGISDVRGLIEAYQRVHGETNHPVLFIDYLQIMRPEDEKNTDKQNMDRTISGLRRIVAKFGISIIVISSFNRNSYTEERDQHGNTTSKDKTPTLASFKESGGIEYGADVVLALFDKIHDRAASEDEKKAEEIKKRDVEIIVLKNRNGPVMKHTKLDYYPAYNYFECKPH